MLSFEVWEPFHILDIQFQLNDMRDVALIQGSESNKTMSQIVRGWLIGQMEALTCENEALYLVLKLLKNELISHIQIFQINIERELFHSVRKVAFYNKLILKANIV